jgi:hypothetical protein
MRIRCKGQRMRSMISNHSWQIRRLHRSDVPQLLDLIGGVRREFGLAARVTSVLEPNDYAIFDVYRHRRSAYFVARCRDRIRDVYCNRFLPAQRIPASLGSDRRHWSQPQ